MTCYRPLKAWAPASRIDGGRYVFDATKALNPDSPTKIPCGRCSGCRQDRVSDWMVRCVHESQTSPASCFITLTYSDEFLPTDHSVKFDDYRAFMRRLRKRFGKGIRFFGCGEYSDAPKLRPHYHALLFNFDFPDKTYWSTRDGNRVFKSEALSELWPFGLHEIGGVSVQSAGYCSQYVQKKQTGPVADDHYFRLSPVDGQMYRVAPEFATMSRMPGLGDVWFDRFAADVFPSDHVIIDGVPRRTPVYYLKRLSEGEAERVKRARRRVGNRYSWQHFAPQFISVADKSANSSPDRLAVREFIHLDRLKRLVRSL